MKIVTTLFLLYSIHFPAYEDITFQRPSPSDTRAGLIRTTFSSNAKVTEYEKSYAKWMQMKSAYFNHYYVYNWRFNKTVALNSSNIFLHFQIKYIFGNTSATSDWQTTIWNIDQLQLRLHNQTFVKNVNSDIEKEYLYVIITLFCIILAAILITFLIIKDKVQKMTNKLICSMSNEI